jgi:hypothetical protein
MPTSDYESLDEALEALAGCDITLKNGNSNHAAMVAEALCAMGRPQAVMPWIARYKERLLPRSAAGDPIRAETWRSALGQRERFADWTEFLGTAVALRSMADKLVNLWLSRHISTVTESDRLIRSPVPDTVTNSWNRSWIGAVGRVWPLRARSACPR